MELVQPVLLMTSVALVVIGLYSAIFIDNIIKKIIGISFIEEGSNMFLVAIGYKIENEEDVYVYHFDKCYVSEDYASSYKFKYFNGRIREGT